MYGTTDVKPVFYEIFDIKSFHIMFALQFLNLCERSSHFSVDLYVIIVSKRWRRL